MIRWTLIFATLIGVVFVFGSVNADAQSVAIVTSNNNCLIPDGNRMLRVFKCTDGGIRYTLDRGQIKTADGYCFDHGIPLNVTSGDRRVKLVRCHGGASQVWWVNKDNLLVESAANWKVCLNIEGGNDSPGGNVIVWPCGFNSPGRNESFKFGGKMDWKQFGSLPYDVRSALNAGNGAFYNNGTQLVAAGGGNMVAAGGGNLVAAGGGNVVPTAGGSLVAAGSLNLVGNDGASIVARLVGLDGTTLRGVGYRIQ